MAALASPDASAIVLFRLSAVVSVWTFIWAASSLIPVRSWGRLLAGMPAMSAEARSAGVIAVGPWLMVTIDPVWRAAGAVAPPGPTSWLPPANNPDRAAGSVATSGGESCQFQNLVRSIFSLDSHAPRIASPSTPRVGSVIDDCGGANACRWNLSSASWMSREVKPISPASGAGMKNGMIAAFPK